jgi:hypothetical protein
MKAIIKVEIFGVLLLLVLGVTWAINPDKNIEPFFAVSSILLVCTEIFRKTTQKHQSESVGVDDGFNDLINRFPSVIKEMKDDIVSTQNSGIRKFFVKSSRLSVNNSEPCFLYHTDVHKDLNAAVMYMCDLNFIEDITPSNCPMYRFKEDFYLRLKNT